ncbi:MAG TPA: rod shape-determining protein MreC [Candidatus Baltobacteraceae bacterium]|nr:rod shape-determining protein MreC [Candidatus Baltobacteraceae bacterium]
MQIAAERSGNESPLTTAGMTFATFLESATSATIGGVRAAGTAVISLPQLERDNAALRAQNLALQHENTQLHELAAQYASEAAVRPIVDVYPRGIDARVIGYPPENESRTVTLDRGSNAGVRKDDGVFAQGGVVGRIASVTPFSSQVILVTDYTSRIPAVMQRGRYWGIARGNLASVRVEYIAQDAAIKIGDVVVTGEGRSFHSGVPIGTITKIERGDATLYQTAVLKPAVDLDALDHVVIVPK